MHGSNGTPEVRLSVTPDGLLHGLRITQPSGSAWLPPGYSMVDEYLPNALAAAVVAAIAKLLGAVTPRSALRRGLFGRARRSG